MVELNICSASKITIHICSIEIMKHIIIFQFFNQYTDCCMLVTSVLPLQITLPLAWSVTVFLVKQWLLINKDQKLKQNYVLKTRESIKCNNYDWILIKNTWQCNKNTGYNIIIKPKAAFKEHMDPSSVFAKMKWLTSCNSSAKTSQSASQSAHQMSTAMKTLASVNMQASKCYNVNMKQGEVSKCAEG